MDVDTPEAKSVTKQPEARLPLPPSLPQRPRSPPRGPRNYVKTPTSARSLSPQPMAAVPSHSPVIGVNAQASSVEGQVPESPATPSSAEVVLPPLEFWGLKREDGKLVSLTDEKITLRASVTQDLDRELQKTRTQRRLQAIERMKNEAELHRAMLELTLTTMEYQYALDRRKVTIAQMEKARMGALGIDYVPPPKNNEYEPASAT
ncbi:hypothetical protein EIP91_002421 [Steccherinum ochraceum]|uniref:Uncharacterized protein n=1 Tax=Steccherinum ochraceum TaxID=92696 RepID=A0A4R0REP2_9APHY|nr:hypothetical protein EIP91_002421 [Steccherinum ochraceum]